jgi:hypothetical protein
MRPLILTLALLCGSAHAEFWDGNTLHQRLNGTPGEQNIALGYVIGVSDALLKATHCMPSNVTAGQLRDMMKNYLENTPAVRHFSADSLISTVLKSQWPCPQGGRPL